MDSLFARVRLPLLVVLVAFFLYSAISLVNVRYDQRLLRTKIDQEERVSCLLQAEFQSLASKKDSLESGQHLVAQTQGVLAPPTSSSFLYVYLSTQDQQKIAQQVPKKNQSIIFSHTSFDCPSQ